MKKMIAVAGLAVLSTSAFATKARMQALGQDIQDGSLFMRDSRTVFLNPSHLVEQKDYIAVEWGTDTATGLNADADTAPMAEGGFFKESGSFVYGLYLGYTQSQDTAALPNLVDGEAGNTNTTAAGDSGFLVEDNRIDLFFGGDAGVQWGVNIGYIGNEDQGGGDVNVDSGTVTETTNFTAEYSALIVKAGVTMGDLEGYVHIDLDETSEGGVAADSSAVRQNDKVEGDTGFTIGGSYSMGNKVIYGQYDNDGYEVTINAASGDYTESTIRVGVAEINEINEKSRWFWDSRLRLRKTESQAILDSNVTESDFDDLQLTVGFESDVKSWLTLRGSVAQQVVYSKEGVVNTANVKLEDSAANTTTVAGGLSLRFGDVSLDATFAAAGQGNIDTSDNNFMGRTAFVYNF